MINITNVYRIVVILFLTTSSFVFAQSADLELDVYIESYDSVFWGFQGDYSVTITNNGPEVASTPGTFTPFMPQDNTDFTFAPNFDIVQPDCNFTPLIAEPRPPDFPGGSIFFISTSPIAVGESVTCFGRFQVGFESGRRETFWETVNLGQGTTISDPVTENNTVTIFLGVPPLPVNAFSDFSTVLIILIVWWLSMKFMRKIKLY